MPELLFLLLSAVAGLIAIQLLADRSGLPRSALLTVGGLLYALLPGPDLHISPEAVSALVLPPLLYSTALRSSLIAIRKYLRPIASLSVGLVLVTALLVGAGFSLVVPGATLAAGVVVGAAVSPPDPVAALAAGRRAGLPGRLITLIEGEGLLNDATALTTLTVAVAATTTGRFSPWSAAAHFVFSVCGGAVAGGVTAAGVHALRRGIRDPLLVTVISLATPFAAYLLGEAVHASAVLAVVVAGLLIGHETPRTVSGSSRLHTAAVWRVIDFALESFVFLLIGQQLPVVLRGLRSYPVPTLAAAAAVTLGGVLLVRPAWLIGTQWLPRRLRLRLGGSVPDEDRQLAGREIIALSWAGTRGVITTTSILTLPLTARGGPFPDRKLMLFCAYLVVIVTLVGQGTTFSVLVRRLRLRRDPEPAGHHDRARAAAARAALEKLDDIAREHVLDPVAHERLRRTLLHRTRLPDAPQRAAGAAPPSRLGDPAPAEGGRTEAGTGGGDRGGDSRAATSRGRARQVEAGQIEAGRAEARRAEAAVRAHRRVIDVQREELVRWRHRGHLSDPDLRLLHNELDHEEGALRSEDAED